MKQRTRLLAIGGLLVLTGLVTIIVGVVSLLETRWVVDPLRYESVDYHGGFRSAGSIHITAVDGLIYRLPARAWPEELSGAELAARLRQDHTAVARVAGGQSRFWFGYPTIEYLETPTLTLEAPADRRSTTLLAALLGAAEFIGGIYLLRAKRRRASA